MVYEEYVRKAIASGRQYHELPERIRTVFSPSDWRNHVKEQCIQRGSDWGSSLARTVCSEGEYYGELLKCYKGWMRMYPYHLAFYVNRVMRISPFRYYIDMLVAMLVAEKAYHQLPNFTAADALRLVGVGRNEYIAILNACKNRRVMWRVNRVPVARELLPQMPKEPARLEPWWGVSCVNLGEAEYRELTPEEMAHVKTASLTSGSVQVRDLDEAVLRELLRKGFVYIEVPVLPEDRFSIPPLEGFVSNKDAAPLGLEGGADPLESVLYAVFVANNERLTVSELAGILNVETRAVQAALGVASRLGFATRVTPSITPDTLASSPSLSGTRGGLGRTSGGGALASSPVQSSFAPLIDLEEQEEEAGAGKSLATAGRFGSQNLSSLAARDSPLIDPFSSGEDERSAAVVLDSEATSFLMMGALSPGLKRHAVTLFEGGRVAGEGVMAEMVQELWSSFAAGQMFEGDMLRLTQFAGALATAIEAVRGGLGPGRSLELLRKESLEGLPPTSASKVRSMGVVAVVEFCSEHSTELLRKESLEGLEGPPPTSASKVCIEVVADFLNFARHTALRSCVERTWRACHAPQDPRCSS
ncbi:FAM91 N-terminus-domain-containing protein [Dunaliella salina]|uniref:FAM91 N-terminus-domain-containing protein n=1 Tax=Dunaliella salina TaxID=3046 RepID=A0ABQ7GBZ6_DUNSA|nr:FAM91 N-terminus-domain-containing protein [Dunaliella salina]|eukprot:KAF5832134.1 FAM91 N-terminus-domain-containing protein [Dunaliella salina]